MPEFIIRRIRSDDLDAIARVHKASFDDRALTQLGRGVLKRYYQWLLTGFSEIHPICAVTQTGDLAGFCFAGVYAGSFSGFLRENKWYLVASILIRPWLLFNPVVRDQVALALKTLKSLLFSKSQKKNTYLTQKSATIKNNAPKSFGILSIAVSPGFQRQGLGELLAREVENWAANNAYDQLHLSVHPDNVPAVKFYEKLGWEKNLSNGGWDGKMYKKLDSK